ncbi:uncharacterized protein LOC128681577 [Plodia interpunctella]|uniref:uncharacterized protein LOC128681577 n=1 Tax=Plodia interpunctella TaxID=58824 RepID=UPI00236742D4|nr:uncharacterized protein LOC128681577 [Plodia interpunctella]XP_053621564.1 uncharacterized protein LOC128681577 [Plodia interpunctella]
MAVVSSKWLLTLLFVACASADDIDVELSTGIMLKMLREMANQTKSDTLNLPANATSIRENITDTFSCENRTYGYYADVDNDCQLFHVCLPSQTPSGRNVTYKWSFICPSETVFNQVVLVCTRPIDSIPCEESEMYYDVNDEFGKVTNDTKTEEVTTEKNKSAPKKDRVRNHLSRKQNIIDIRQHNIVPEEVLKDIVDEELNKEYIDVEKDAEMNPNIPIDIEMEIEPQMMSNKDDIAVDDVDSRLASERSMKFRGRRVGRGHYKYDPHA